MNALKLYRSAALKLKNTQKGFTLIELLVVIGILAVLLAIVLVAINPAKQFASANDTKRSSDVNAILNAVHQYAADNKGTMPGTFSTDPALPTAISDAGTGAAFCNFLVTEYLAALPSDPQVNNGAPVDEADCAAYTTGYTIYQSATNNRITVSAPGAEGTAAITVTR